MEYGKKITTESYEKGELTATRHHYEIPVMTSRVNILNDLIDSLAPLTKGDCNKLELDIRIDRQGRWKLVKKYQIDTNHGI